MVTLADPYYRVHLTVGPYSWDIERGDPADYGPVDGLKIGWSLPDNAAWPTQPDIPWARFGVIVEDAADFAGVDIGAEVAIGVYAHPASDPLPSGYQDGSGTGKWVPVALFGGRVVELEAEPHGLGLVYRLSCLDYLVDLADNQISDSGATGWPGESIENRLTRISDSASDVFGSVPWVGFNGPEAGWGIFHANPEPDLKGALAHFVEHLAQYVLYGHYDPPLLGGARGILTTNNALSVYDIEDTPATMAPPDAQRYSLVWRFREYQCRQQGGWLPGTLRNNGLGQLEPSMQPDENELATALGGPLVPPEAIGIIPSSVVEFDATWSRTKKARAERVRAQTTLVFVDAPTAKRATAQLQGTEFTSLPPPTVVLDTSLGYRDEAADLAEFILADPAHAARWEVEKFRLLADLVPDRLTRGNSVSWFLLASVPIGQPLVGISGVPIDQNPNQGAIDHYAGLLTSAEFTIQDGRYWIDFTLSREIPRPAAGTDLATSGAVSPASLAVSHPTLSPNQVATGHSVYDWRIVRRED